MNIRKRVFSGVISEEVSQRELVNRDLSRKAGGEGVVLLKNDNSLPLAAASKVAVYGNGIQKFIKGGSGSGDVNEREVVSLVEGLKAAGLVIVNDAAVQKNMADYQKARMEWRERIIAGAESTDTTGDLGFLRVLTENKMKDVDLVPVEIEDLKDAEAAIYMISRQAGEGKDRRLSEGEWYLTEKEKEQLSVLSKNSDNLIVLINVGGQIDIADLEFNPGVKAIVFVGQPGMEAGHVVADILTGKVCPSGRLATTWAEKYEDFPNAATYSFVNGDTDNEKYEEGIYVGYRYFDSFAIQPLYPFGYGLSYTEFKLEPVGTRICEKAENATHLQKSGSSVCRNQVCVSVQVMNTGAVSGKQVVQIYAACPQGKDGKELKRLVGFGKTKLLEPGEKEILTIEINEKNLASFIYDKSAWVVENGRYFLLAGENSASLKVAGILDVAQDCIIEKVPHICPLQKELNEIKPDGAVICAARKAWEKEAAEKGVEAIAYAPSEVIATRLPESPYIQKAREIAQQMTNEELTAMLMGEITKGQDNIVENQLVETGMFVPGAAGETSCRFTEKYGIPAIAMADGPAGLRLAIRYEVDNASGKIYGQGMISSLYGGFLAKDYHRENVTIYHMYATSFPVGTLLAQTWNTDLVEKIGQAVGGEMNEFGVSWWLAPGMCIHRNPLCGRNFEYYSEDPIITGEMAAAMTIGVQSRPGVGTTVKHYACNNQEDNRFFSDSILSERALREIYIRGFEIAVKKSQPMCVMTSYNKINGVTSANNTDIIDGALRKEWDFKGIVMTDWTSTSAGSATAYKCAIAGNDLIMPAKQSDVDNIMEAFESGNLPREKAVECVTRLISVLFATSGMEDAKPYK